MTDDTGTDFPELNRLSASDLTRLLTEEPPRRQEIIDRLYVVGGVLPAAETPPLLLRTRVLIEMALDVSVHDVGRFFESWPSESGAYGNDAIGWCDEMGAPDVAQMLRDAIALLPDGVLPREFQARNHAMDTARERARPNKPFAALGERYSKAVEDLPDALIAFLLARRADLLRELAQVERAVVERDTTGLVRIKGAMKFLEAVYEAVARRDPTSNTDVGWDQMSPARRVGLWFRGVYVYVDVGAGGMWKLLSDGTAYTDWDRAQRWCRAIGADRLSEYLVATAAVFPDGRIPSDYDERVAIVDAIMDDETDEANALERIDDDEGALDEMVVALRAFVKAHGVDWIAAIERVERGELVTPPAKERSKRTKAARKPTAEEKALAKFAEAQAPEMLGHPALDALSNAAHALSLADWMRLVRSPAAQTKPFEAAHARIMAASVAVAPTRTPDEARESQRIGGRAYTVAFMLLERLPKTFTDAEGKLPLELRGAQLLHAAQRAIFAHDEGAVGVKADITAILELFGPSVVQSLSTVERRPAK
jgi:hypothetical protein